MEPSEFLVHCQILLEEKNTRGVLNALQDDSNNKILADVGWELISVLCKELAKCEDEGHLIDIEKSLLELLQRCNAKEVMLGLSEHLATESSLKSFTITMRLCKLTFVQLERRQSKYMANLCKHFTSKMKYLLESSSQAIDATSKKDENSLVIEASSNFLHSSIDFFDGIMSHIGRTKSIILESYLCESVSGKSWSSYEISCCREVAIDFIFNILHSCVESKIFSMPSLSKYKETISELLLYVFRLFSFPDLLDYLKWRGNKQCDHVGVVIFFDLILVQCLAGIELPLVYECTYWFDFLAPYLDDVLKLSSASIVHITLDLLSLFLVQLNTACSSPDLLPHLQTMAINLTKIMIWCQEQELRKRSEELLQALLQRLDKCTRFLLLCHVYEQTDHPGVHGYLINLIMKSTEELMLTGDSLTKIDICDLALLFTKIAVGENNILHESDKYMAALNFVRFWLLRDSKKNNKTGIWNKMADLNKNMSVMSNCIDLSKCEFEKQLHQLHHPNKNVEDDFCTDMITSLPGGEIFSQLSTNDKVATVNKALLTLDVMSSVIGRIGEITSTKVE